MKRLRGEGMGGRSVASLPLLPLAFLCCLHLVVSSAEAGTFVVKTPDDVYAKVVVLKEQVEFLRGLNNVQEAWPEVPQQHGKAPRHVLQKSLEVLEKIKRLRVIRKIGSINIPPYPARDITPNEVYEMVGRLVDEMDLVLRILSEEKFSTEETVAIGRSPNDVYRELWAVSLAMDPVLGIRGFNPSDVYAQSVRVLEEVRFLRLTQNLPSSAEPPERTQGKHPNHALRSSYDLLSKIAQAERNLWIQPPVVPEVPRRVITPSDVHDALQVVIAELQRIKYRLGVERNFDTPHPEVGKTPDDVIQNLTWAEQLMPDFALDKKLIQHDKRSLEKTPNHVFALTEHMLDELHHYRALRGIQAIPREPLRVSGLQPKHVYQKTLECMEKVNRLRIQSKIGPIVVPEYPLREITPSEVYELAEQLHQELEIVYEQSGMNFSMRNPVLKLSSNKTPDDVHSNMWLVSYLIDTILGSEGYTTDDVYVQARRVISEIELVARYLGRDMEVEEPPLQPGLVPRDVIIKSAEVLALLKEVQLRSGLFTTQTPTLTALELSAATPNDVFNEVRIILAELAALKLNMGITTYAEKSPPVMGKTPSHVYQLLDEARAMLSDLLGR